MQLGLTWKAILSTTAFSTLCLLTTGQQAQAASWKYSIDSFRDGTEASVIGDKSQFEFYGMAYKQTRDKLYFAFNSNLSLDGYQYKNALNGKISYGDLFLNFADTTSFDKANGKLYGIRFDQTNDTRFVSGSGKKKKVEDPKLGLYESVTATSVTTRNVGYSSLQQHTNTVNKQLKGHASYGDLAADTQYFDSSKAAFTSMASGSFLGAIEKIADFSKLGLNFAQFNAKGTYTFGFSVDKKLLPNGKFMASLFAECGNDGMVLAGELKDVPEPSLMAGLVTVGLLAASSRRRQATQA
ncbi:MAG: PEP-CTERM sorting domain-containing protein [Elainella sp. C42_A2020_010]|nr:PEP-CTERM sorting domain-containing protein [Elainella sp. C42_A2020_010]RNJ69315.1 MAG: PEP-CTERM sorting domain-containing protein [Leptolyngbya sp. IPPAS B-1204]